MSCGAQPDELEKQIGYVFRNRDLLVNALTHSSYAFENGTVSNQRLEFLGDAVVGLVIGKALYLRYPHVAEGRLSEMKRELVCGQSLGETARGLNLGAYLCLGRGEEKKNARGNPSILADAFEALIGAVYLENPDAAERVCLSLLGGRLARVSGKEDPKARLQQAVQQGNRGGDAEELTYAVVAEVGPDHDKLFVVDVYLNSNRLGTGIGKTKHAAEQEAALDALGYFGEPTCGSL